MPSDPYVDLDAMFAERLRALVAAAPGKITLSGGPAGRRSREQQAALHRQKPHLAAPPGKSKHEHGLAYDLVYENKMVEQWAHANAPRFGLRFPMLTRAPGRKYEPWHIELAGGIPQDESRDRRPVSAAPASPAEDTGMPNAYAYEMEDRHDIGYQLVSLTEILTNPIPDELFHGSNEEEAA